MKKSYPFSVLREDGGYILIIVTLMGLVLAILLGTILPRLHTAQLTRATSNLNEMRANEAARMGINAVRLGCKDLENFQELIGYHITGVSNGINSFAIAGNYAYRFESGTSLQIYFSQGNDGTYTVSGSTNNITETDISVDEAIPVVTSTVGVLCRNNGIIWAIDQVIGGVSEPLTLDEYRDDDGDIQFVSGCSNIDLGDNEIGALHMAIFVSRGGDIDRDDSLYFYNDGMLNNSGISPWITENTAPAGLVWANFDLGAIGNARYIDFDLSGQQGNADFKYWYEAENIYASLGNNGSWRGQDTGGNELWTAEGSFSSGGTPFQGKDNDGDGDIDDADKVEVFIIVRSTGITAAPGASYATDKTSLRLVNDAYSHLPNPMRKMLQMMIGLSEED